MEQSDVAILKTIWSRLPDGRWGIYAIKGLPLDPSNEQDYSYFSPKPTMQLMTNSPAGLSVEEVFRSFGSTDFLIQQSIVPVVSLVHGERRFRVIGTGFFVSCTGYLMTACHVVLDPEESGYGTLRREGRQLHFVDGLSMGVLVRVNPAIGSQGVVFFPFESCTYWGDWRENPLVHEKDRFEMPTDIAVCKVPMWPSGEGHQPLNLSLNQFAPEDSAFAIGYAEMPDVLMSGDEGSIVSADPQDDVYVSVGNVMQVFAENHVSRQVPTPGPCFDFAAKVPGKMSGAPVFGAGGAVVRGVVSRSFSEERHAYGAMIGPALQLPLSQGATLRELMDSGNEGIARVEGSGL